MYLVKEYIIQIIVRVDTLRPTEYNKHAQLTTDRIG